MIKYITHTQVQSRPGKVDRAKERNLVTAFFVFRNTGNQPAVINERRLDIGEEFDTRTPFLAIDDTNYEINFSNDTRSNCADAGVAEITITRFDLIT